MTPNATIGSVPGSGIAVVNAPTLWNTIGVETAEETPATIGIVLPVVSNRNNDPNARTPLNSGVSRGPLNPHPNSASQLKSLMSETNGVIANPFMSLSAISAEKFTGSELGGCFEIPPMMSALTVGPNWSATSPKDIAISKESPPTPRPLVSVMLKTKQRENSSQATSFAVPVIDTVSANAENAPRMMQQETEPAPNSATHLDCSRRAK